MWGELVRLTGAVLPRALLGALALGLAWAAVPGLVGCSAPRGHPLSTAASPGAPQVSGGGLGDRLAPAWVAAALPDSGVWGLPGVRVERDAGSGATPGGPAGDVVVVGTVSPQQSAQLRDIGIEAVRVVRRAWRPSWDGRLLVVAPVDRRQWAAVAGPAPTVGPAMTVSGPGGSAYVVIDPVAWQAATTAGRRALLIHEAVHVAVSRAPAPTAADATPAAAPLWLSEGFAQLVAYDAVGAQIPLIAGGLLERVRRHGPPQRLPDDASFAAEPPRRLDAYAQAWLACLTLERLGGATAPRRALAGGGPQAVGLDVAALTAAWQSDLRRWAAAAATDRPKSSP